MAEDRHATDPYASRVGGAQRLVPRSDPVLWGGVDEPGPLSPAQLADFERRGHIVLEDWLDEGTIERCLTELDRLVADPVLAHDERLVREPGSQTIRSVFDVHKLSQIYAALAADERVSGVARQILADDVYIHQSRANLKPALVGHSFSWHSDFETWHVEDGMPAMRAVSCAVALTDNHVWNGPLLLLDGSHHTFVAFAGTTPDDNYRTSLRKQEYGVPDLDTLTRLEANGGIETFAAGAGSVVFFDCNIMHASPNNVSPRSRTNAFFVYNAWSNRLRDPFGTTTSRPEHIADRSPTAPLLNVSPRLGTSSRRSSERP